MRVAITGHRGLSDEIERFVESAIRQELRKHTDVTGISCLADGADQIFARAVVEAGGRLEIVVPAAQYRDGLPAMSHQAYDQLLATAAHIERLDHIESTEQSHMDASRTMLDRADLLLAVWDGEPARGYGGTADVVMLARERQVPVTVIWPAGARRD